MFQTYRLEMILTICSIALIGAAFLLGRAQAGEWYASPCMGDQAESSACWTSYYRDLIDRRGSSYALQNLQRRYEDGDASATFCHPILHIIGAAAALEYQSVGEAFQQGETFCRAGYFHGVLEGYFEHDGATLISKLDSMCSAMPGKDRYSYTYYSCVHGIGHGLMAYFDHDVVASLQGCDALTGTWEQGACYGGVFMENVISDTPDMPSRFLRADDPLYPCTAVEDRYRYQCYQMQTSYMLTLFDGDFSKTFAACRGVQARYQDACFQSIGRDASGWSYGNGETAHALCQMGITTHERTECLIGAAVDYIQSEGVREARALCARGVEEGERDLCTQTLETQIRAL